MSGRSTERPSPKSLQIAASHLGACVADDTGLTIAVIPARGGSKSIPRKNLVSLGGRPLLAWSIEVARQVNAIDTNGAGDMFAGAFLAAMTQGRDPIEAATFANGVAALVVAQYGPRLHPDQYEALLHALSTTG